MLFNIGYTMYLSPNAKDAFMQLSKYLNNS